VTAAEQLTSRLRSAVAALPPGLSEHVLRVEVEALRLARAYDVDPEGARLAALGHDLVRHRRGPELLDLAARYDLTPDAVERAAPILVHGPVAARILGNDYGLGDADVLAAVDCHTTARAGMSRLEKVLFVADKIEPQKLVQHPAWREVHDLAERDLDAAILRYLDLQLEETVRRHWLLHPRSLEARNQLSLNLHAAAG
jgi:predicted HD superfamily hydrolase involved in NAD metabolism